MADRCPLCSFDPTSKTDFCDEHQPIMQADLQAAVYRTQFRCEDQGGPVNLGGPYEFPASVDDWALIYRAMRNAGLAK